MNITDLIVELLKEGRHVELPGMGTFDSEVQSPRHDPQTQIYYPATRNILFKTECSGNNDIVREIAVRECVNEDIAEQMWNNYMDALTDKLSRCGSHRFGEMGMLSKEGENFRFKMAEGLVIEAGNSSEKPLEGVKTYVHNDNEDPFAQFEETTKAAVQSEPTIIQKPESEPLPEPKPEPEPEPEPIPEPEPEPIPEPEPELIPEPEPEPKPEPKVSPVDFSGEPKTEPKPVPEEALALQDTLKKLDDLPKSKAVLKAEAKAEKEHAKAAAKNEKRVRKEELKLEKKRKKQEKENQKQEKAIASKSENIVVQEKKEEKPKEENEKKGHKWLLWLLLLLLLLLLAGGGYYYYTHYMQNNSDDNIGATVGGKHLDIPSENDLTYNCDDIVYNTNEIARNSDMVCLAMDEYINEFLVKRNFRNAKAPMMARIRDYANQRMNELMGNRFAVQRLIPYSDYINEHCKPWMKSNYAGIVRNIIQGELMDLSLLEDILGKLNLEPNNKQFTAEDVQKVKQKEREAVKKNTDNDIIAPSIHVAKESKQGFDIIAGFYINRNTANKMTSRLKSQGCDAYIIEKNDGYYVSMGSAPTRTKAEALFNHLKSWYDGDIAIKQW